MKCRMLISIGALVLSCGENPERQEVLVKLRALGAATQPVVATASTSGDEASKVELTVYAAVPEGRTVAIRPFKDQAIFGIHLLEESAIEVQTSSIAYTAYSGFQLLTFKALLAVPPATIFQPSGGVGQVRYGFLLDDGSKEEKVVGNFWVYPPGAPELGLLQPQITDLSPVDGAEVAADGEVDIAATLLNANSEELTVGWFASGGEIKNRRAKATTWTAPSAGPQTLIFTVRGKKSRGFAIRVVKITAQ